MACPQGMPHGDGVGFLFVMKLAARVHVLAAKAEQGKAAKSKPAPQPGRWLDRDCNAALNMQPSGSPVAPAGAVPVARPGSSTSQGQGVPGTGLQAAARAWPLVVPGGPAQREALVRDKGAGRHVHVTGMTRTLCNAWGPGHR
ncbi:hypothetical protein HaLaN_11606 [Haematococcus lacustris]|uniref:Uncharacterized protein n=1 Tax=Haematococcus lacustris TaxID=44745 RepID=A0A699Z1K1_HAELA|nr:hypothetical protein HaLaN_11606 [Haematococcus lacustris]